MVRFSAGQGFISCPVRSECL